MELAALLLTDFDTAVQRIVAQPFCLAAVISDKTYADVFSNPRLRFKRPIPYRHPNGAVSWVRLPK
jgi:hypothetical protein